jgi:hypothetical protein
MYTVRKGSLKRACNFLFCVNYELKENINSTSLKTQVENLLALHIFSHSLGNKEELI